MVPFLLYVITYRKNPESKNLKYILSLGFSILYAFVLLTAVVPTTFVYIFMVFIMIIPYGDIRLCYITGGIAILANIVSIVYGFMSGSLTTVDLAMVEIQIAAIVIGALFVGLAVGRDNIHQLLDSVGQSETVGAMVRDKMNELMENTKR